MRRDSVNAICDYVHDRIIFGYAHASPTKTAWDVHNERRDRPTTPPPPLAFTDPNWYCFLGMCTWGKAIGASFRGMSTQSIAGSLFEIAAVALCAGNPVCMFPAAFLSTTLVAGITSGDLGYALQSGTIALVTAVAFYEVGSLTNVVAGKSFFAPHITPAFGTPEYLFNVAGHALVGCAQSAASGGKCGSGALSGGITSGAGPAINGRGVASLVANSVLGGLASVAGGGKFANGAITGAFGYLFNAMADCMRQPMGCQILESGGKGGGYVGPGAGALVAAGVTWILTQVDVISDWLSGATIYNSKLGPDPDAVGPHTTWKTDPITGEITRTETWVPNPQNPSGWDSEQATDVTGRGHYDKGTGQVIPTPHTHLPDGSVRPATPDEIPR